MKKKDLSNYVEMIKGDAVKFASTQEIVKILQDAGWSVKGEEREESAPKRGRPKKEDR